MEDEMFLLADKYKELRDKKDELREQEKLLENELDDIEWKLIQMMTDKEMKNFTRKGVMFIVTNKKSVSIIPELKDDLYKEVHDMEMDDLFTISTNSLKGRLKELADDPENNEKVERLSRYLNEYEKQTISLRR